MRKKALFKAGGMPIFAGWQAAYLRSHNGSEFIAKEVQRWVDSNQFKTINILTLLVPQSIPRVKAMGV